MSVDIIKRLVTCTLIVLLQVLLLNHIRLFGCATPLMYIYYILLFPQDVKRWEILLWGFFLGLAIDIFQNTPGLTAASLTLMALLQPYVLNMFKPRDSEESYKPSMRTMGASKFINYVVMCVVIHNVVLFSLEWFSLFDPLAWLLNTIGSSLITIVLIIIIEYYRKR